MTGTQLCYEALLLLAAVAPGETPTTEEAADAFIALQEMLASWSANELLMFATRTAVVALSAGVQSYAIPGTRPKKVISADVVVTGILMQVEVCGPDRWAQIEDRQSSSAKARAVYCDYAYPTPAVVVGPIPSAAGVLNLYCTVDLTALANAGATFDMPEGYTRAVRYNLAVDLAPIFGKPVPPEVAAVATESKATLRDLIASNRAGKSKLAVPPTQG